MIPRRPIIEDVWDDVLMDKAKELAFALSNKGDKISESFIKGIYEDLKDCILEINDGYANAKALDELRDWAIDTTIVEILDELPIYTHIINATKRWVEKTGARLKLREEDKVQITINVQVPNTLLWKPKEVEGEIIALNHEIAQYTIFCESEGHVRNGVGTNGFIINGEDIENGLEFSQEQFEFEEMNHDNRRDRKIF